MPHYSQLSIRSYKVKLYVGAIAIARATNKKISLLKELLKVGRRLRLTLVECQLAKELASQGGIFWASLTMVEDSIVNLGFLCSQVCPENGKRTNEFGQLINSAMTLCSTSTIVYT